MQALNGQATTEGTIKVTLSARREETASQPILLSILLRSNHARKKH
jgi:hypothetical protein